MATRGRKAKLGRLRTFWPWLVVFLTVIPAVWHVLDFDEDLDVEFPAVIRPVFSRVPPSAYRLAEPGDTLDRIMIYLSAAGVVFACSGLVLGRGGGLWPAALAICAAAWWYSGTPGRPLTAGTDWAGSIANPAAPVLLRRAYSRRLWASAASSRQMSGCTGTG